jgi:hypothetical protein
MISESLLSVQCTRGGVNNQTQIRHLRQVRHLLNICLSIIKHW